MQTAAAHRAVIPGKFHAFTWHCHCYFLNLTALNIKSTKTPGSWKRATKRSDSGYVLYRKIGNFKRINYKVTRCFIEITKFVVCKAFYGSFLKSTCCGHGDCCYSWDYTQWMKSLGRMEVEEGNWEAEGKLECSIGYSNWSFNASKVRTQTRLVCFQAANNCSDRVRFSPLCSLEIWL